MEEIKGVAVPRIKLSETKVFALRDEAARIERENALIDAVSAINVGAVVSLTISGPATTKSDKNDGSTHCFGAFVDIGGIKGLLHVSEVAGDHPKAQRTRLENFTTGSTVEVEIIEARVEGGRAFVRVSEKAAAVKKAMERLPVGSKVSATVVGSDVVGNEHGLIVNIGGIKAFLPEADANVTNIDSLTKSRGQTVKVTITAGFVDGMVKVTRKGK
jgi:ribosomal protein S1